MSKITLLFSLLFSFSSFSQYSDTLSCSGGALEYVVHYDQQQCASVCDGRYEIEILSGVGPYNYTVTGSAYSHNNFEDSLLCPGLYDIQVEDVGQTITCNLGISIDALTVMSYNPGVTPSSGGGACDGEAWISVTGGVPSYTYVWFDAGQVVIPGETDSIMTNLCAGVYYVKVYDNAIDCQDSTGFIQLTVLNPPLSLIITMTYEEVCPGSCDAGFDYTVTGGSGNYTYMWNGFGAMGGGQEYPTCPIDGTFEVWDDAGGYASAFVFFNQWPGITIFPAATDESCGGTCDGIIFFDDQWAPGADQYSIDGGNTFQPSPTFNNLCPNTYDVYAMVTDAYGGWGCVIDLGMMTVQAGEANPLLVTDLAEDNTCLTDCNGSGDLDVTGNTGVYTVEWFDDLGTLIGIGDSIDSLCGGIYDYTVIDPNGCSFSDSILILDPPPIPPLNYTITTTNVTATGLCDGTATITITGGLPPYTITWYDANQVPIPNESTPTIDSLCIGQYYVSFNDSPSGGCGTGSGSGGLIPFAINEPLGLVLVFEQQETCPWLCDATATFQAFGGTGNYTYDFNGMTNATGDFWGLCPGFYTVSVTDDMGNFAVITYEILPINPPSVFVIATNETCTGACDGIIEFNDFSGEAEQFSIDGGITWSFTSIFNGLCFGNYDCWIMTTNGCPVWIDNISVLQGATFTPSLTYNVADELCYQSCDGTVMIIDPSGDVVQYSLGGTFSGSDLFLGLCAGDYDVIVQNAQGCEATYPAAVTVGQPDSISIILQLNEVGCNYPCNGQLTATATGGTGTLEYSLDGNTWFASAIFDNLCPGIQTLYVRDTNGCQNTLSFEFVGFLSLTVSTTVNTGYSDVTNCTGDISTDASGGKNPYQFEWFECNTGNSITQGDNPTDLCPGEYYVRVTDLNGCTATSPPCDTIHSVAGYDLLTLPNWSVYPNPATSSITIDGLGDENGTVTLIDSRGRIITTLEFDSDELVIDLQMNPILQGMYIIRVEQNGQVQYKRIVVQ